MRGPCVCQGRNPKEVAAGVGLSRGAHAQGRRHHRGQRDAGSVRARRAEYAGARLHASGSAGWQRARERDRLDRPRRGAGGRGRGLLSRRLPGARFIRLRHRVGRSRLASWDSLTTCRPPRRAAAQASSMGAAGGGVPRHCPDRHPAARADRPGRRRGHRAVSLLRRDRDLPDRADPAQRRPPRGAPARRAARPSRVPALLPVRPAVRRRRQGRRGPRRRQAGPDSEPAGPVLYPFAGGGGPHSFVSRWWTWPLPPAGPLEFVCEWPAFGIAESRAGIDAQLILDAARRSVRLWPEDED